MKEESGSNKNWHALSTKEVLKELRTTEQGLSPEEAALRLERHGLNELTEKDKQHPFLIFLKQFKSFFVYILIVAVGISYAIGHLTDVYVIIGVLIINASLGFFEEYKAERSIAALKKIIVQSAKVIRNNEVMKIPAAQIVPGDIILLEEGDRIPADARIFSIKNFSVVESSLTGESIPVIKKSDAIEKEKTLADKNNMVWMGTFAASGTAKAVVIATGDRTTLGQIAHQVEQIKEGKSHFQQKTDRLAIQMGLLAIIGASLVFFIGFFIRGFAFFDILLFTIASLVSGIPEGLPAVLAIVLAVGAFRMARRNALIRKLPATETLAVVDTIITDKTGTLTENKMAVRTIALPGEEQIQVSGKGWEPFGSFMQGKSALVALEKNTLRKLLHISALCTGASLVKEKNDGEGYTIIGDPTEAALVVVAEKAGLKKNIILEEEKKIDDLPFNQQNNYRACMIEFSKEKRKELYAVGAPESILQRSTHILKYTTRKSLTKLEKQAILQQIDKLTQNAMRVIALAYREVPFSLDNVDEHVHDLTYVGVVGIIDPPREEVKDALAKARKAGIRVIMVTGDHKNTALAIAQEIGLPAKIALTEEDLLKLNQKEFEKAINEVNVFARVTPQMKLKIADTLQKSGKIVAMTGDGVNDAPALKKADIGIAMGVIGTDVAREASEIVLADDNFASIVHAIEEGKIVFINTRQASFFLVTTNFAEHVTILTTLLLGMPLPLIPVQILWLNLVTDTGSGIGLALEPSHNQIHEERPRSSKENILTKEILPFLLLMSVTMAGLTAITFLFYLSSGVELARTGAFVVMAFTQLYNTMNMRDLRKSLFVIGIKTNKYLLLLLGISLMLIVGVLYIPVFQHAFGFAFIHPLHLAILFILSSLVLWLGEGYKRIKRR